MPFINLALGLLLGVTPQEANPTVVQLKYHPSGMTEATGSYTPQPVDIGPEAPAGLVKKPDGLKAPSYGVLEVQHKKRIFIEDRPTDSDWRLFFDANGNGDLTDEPPIKWIKRPYRNNSQYSYYIGWVDVDVAIEGKPTKARFGVYNFDNRNPEQADVKDKLFFYSDYFRDGQIKLGSKTYPFRLQDRACKLDFTGVETAPNSPKFSIVLQIDLNGNGKQDMQGEGFDIREPFNIGGTTYEIQHVAADGGSFEVVPSKRTVAEIPVPPDLSPGHKVFPFQAVTTDGKKISFPGAYKGKIVLLDFWATWCPPCMAEMPNVSAAYKKFHSDGFEILGVSLDNPESAKKIPSVIQEQNMPWPQICDEKYWEAAIARQYGVFAIPQSYLVDGDTGVVLAEGGQLREAGLAKAITEALAKKKARS